LDSEQRTELSASRPDARDAAERARHRCNPLHSPKSNTASLGRNPVADTTGETVSNADFERGVSGRPADRFTALGPSLLGARSNSAVCGALHTAEFERGLIRARTDEGHARVKARGVHVARPAALTPHQQAEARKRRDNGETLMDIARTNGVSHTTISRL
jgi:hypothetical protein